MKRLLAIILAVVLLSSMATGIFAAPSSPDADAWYDFQEAEDDIVVTVDEIKDDKPVISDEIVADEGDTITFDGLPEDTLSVVTVTIPDATDTIVLRDKATGNIVLGVLNEDGTYSALVEGDCQLEVIDNEPDFADMPTEPWAEEAINKAAALELLVGYEDGKFHPDDTLTGAQVVTVLARLNELLGGPKMDTLGEDWYVAPLKWANAANITDGKDPFVPFTRQQLIDILAKYTGIEGNEDDFTAWAVATGIFVGDETGDLRGTDNLTRAQFAAVLTRYIENVIFHA